VEAERDVVPAGVAEHVVEDLVLGHVPRGPAQHRDELDLEVRLVLVRRLRVLRHGDRRERGGERGRRLDEQHGRAVEHDVSAPPGGGGVEETHLGLSIFDSAYAQPGQRPYAHAKRNARRTAWSA
jgi:hypothetical protein